MASTPLELFALTQTTYTTSTNTTAAPHLHPLPRNLTTASLSVTPKPPQIWYDSSSHRPRQTYYPAARQQNKPPVEEIVDHQIQFGTANADYECSHRPIR
jgi:hypothetical protein